MAATSALGSCSSAYEEEDSGFSAGTNAAPVAVLVAFSGGFIGEGVGISEEMSGVPCAETGEGSGATGANASFELVIDAPVGDALLCGAFACAGEDAR